MAQIATQIFDPSLPLPMQYQTVLLQVLPRSALGEIVATIVRFCFAMQGTDIDQVAKLAVANACSVHWLGLMDCLQLRYIHNISSAQRIAAYYIAY